MGFLRGDFMWKRKKVKMIRLIVGLMMFAGTLAEAYIPSSKMILEKWADNNTTGPVYFEQEVLLHGPDSTASLKEIWYVESENSLVLMVQGQRELKDKIAFKIQYSNKRKQSDAPFLANSESWTSNFYEPLFFVKAGARLVPYIIGAGIVGQELQNSSHFEKQVEKQKETFVYKPEPFLRLGRTGGVVAYIFSGTIAMEDKVPGLWVEQDQFLLRKIRNSKKIEMSIDKWGSYTKGWKLPKERSYTWADKSAQIRMLEVRAPQPQLKAQLLKTNAQMTTDFELAKERPLIEDFYKMLR